MGRHPGTLVAIDWGSSALRGARVDRHGRVLEQRSFAHGALGVAPGGFSGVFDNCFGDWTNTRDTTCLIAGMAGSRQGWHEAPYCACPAGFDEVAAALSWLKDGPRRVATAIVPGLRCEHACNLPGLEVIADVMRGEEVQILGAMRLTGMRDGVFVLPGTHSKWAQVSGARVTGFRTFMSGEFFALLSRHSILAGAMTPQAPPDEAAFALGVQRAGQGGGLLQHAFGVRTLSLFAAMSAPALTSYLSGLVIGEELCTQQLARDTEVVLIGAPRLTQRYARALALHGVRTRALGEEATWEGLFALSMALGQPGQS